jgi:5-methylcytosine-specific restriction endonuclease McrA
LDADYASGGDGEFTERGPWTTGNRILQEARQSAHRVPLLFAPAEADIIGGVIYWALIDDITLTRLNTIVRFSGLQRIPKKWPLSSLIKLSTGEPLSNNYIRPYVPCRTPSFLTALASAPTKTVAVPDVEAEEISAREGAVSTRQHLHRERDSAIVAAKRREVLSATGRLACSVCDFDFRQFYGDLGEEFCEVHHLRSLADADGEVETRLDDLAVVCSNCHRMLHRSHPFLTLDQLKSKIRNG